MSCPADFRHTAPRAPGGLDQHPAQPGGPPLVPRACPTSLPLLTQRRRSPIFVAFDVLVARGEDVRACPLARRKAVLKRLARDTQRWIALTDGVPGQGRRPFDLVTEMDLEGIVAKRLGDPYAPSRTTWFKILNRSFRTRKGGRNCSSARDQTRQSPA
jgi:hypothetical protein